MIYIIGTGPASLAATIILLKKKKKVSIIDVGKDFDVESKVIKENLKKDKKNFFHNIYNVYKNETKSAKSNLHKTFFGSDHVFDHRNVFTKNQDGTAINISHAFGGFSNTWGGVCLPMFKDDYKDWPIKEDNLKKYYKLISNLMHIQSDDDVFNKLSNFNCYKKFDFNLTNLGGLVMEQLKQRYQQLKKKKIFFSRAKLAINRGCIECGLCMHGCPHDIIFNSKVVFEKLFKEKKINLILNKEVQNFFFENGKLFIKTLDVKTQKYEVLRSTKVLVGCGAIGTLKILKESFDLNNEKIYIKNKDLYFIPAFFKRGGVKELNYNSNSMCQIIIKKFKSKFNYYLQIFTFSDIFFRNFFKRLPILVFILKFRPFNFFLKRFFLIQLITPSNVSDEIQCIIKNNEVFFKKKKNFNELKIKNIMNEILKLEKFMNSYFIKFLTKKISTGGGTHFGSYIPMVKKPKHLQCNINGNLFLNGKKIENVYFIDSSVLTNLPSSPITFTTMANSMRIADRIVC